MSDIDKSGPDSSIPRLPWPDAMQRKQIALSCPRYPAHPPIFFAEPTATEYEQRRMPVHQPCERRYTPDEYSRLMMHAFDAFNLPIPE